MQVREALAAAARRLGGTSATARLDAELLMASALDIPREQLLLSPQTGEAPPSFAQLVDRRADGEPVAYITGRRGFWTIELEVGPGVLVPRPDSETLIEAALLHFGEDGPATILDLGTGSGALLLAALDQWPQATGIGVDISETALAIAKGNAERLGLADRSRFLCSDWDECVRGTRFDLILCNPPYVEEDAELPRDVAEWEPHDALFAGEDGMACYRRLAPVARDLLGENGLACLEIGAGQAQMVASIFSAEGLKVSSREDLGGHVRCLIVRT
jgi:release factor glutamine methyltransferase